LRELKTTNELLRCTSKKTDNVEVKLPRVSVIIPVYNGEKDIEDCILSILNQNYQNYEIIAVDNNSSDGSSDIISEKFPHVKLLRMKYNAGFAGSVNYGIKMSNGDVICILAQDTIVNNDFLTNGVNILYSDDKIGIVSPKIKFYNENLIWYAGGKILSARELIKNKDIKITSHIGKFELDDGRFDNISETDYATGCAMMIRREVINKIGLLDDRYFMYFEDVDWCIRAVNKGYKIYYVPSMVAYHKIAKKENITINKSVVYLISLFRFLIKRMNIKYTTIWILKFPISAIYTVISKNRR